MKTSKKSVAIDRSMATLCFDQPVRSVSGVSDHRQNLLTKLGIRSVRDLLGHYPRRYLDLSCVCSIADARVGGSFTIAGEVYEIKLKTPKPRLTLVEITLTDRTGAMVITCFRQPWLMDKLSAGMRIAVSGEVSFNYGMKRMTNPFLEVVGDGSVVGKVIPIHPATEKLTPAIMRNLMRNALDMVAGVEEFLPLELREKYRLMSRGSALESIHFPRSLADQHQARRRLAYEEVLMLQLHMQMEEAAQMGDAVPVRHCIDGPCLERYYSNLPFALSEEQFAAVNEILSVLADDSVARHLLLGDVGTGKTVVAGFALCAAVDTGNQAMMMAPTEVLAKQYGVSLAPLLEASGVRCALLTGSTDSTARSELLASWAAGEVDVLFGTHALLEPDVVAPRVSVVVVDEQQRFGVAQRQALLKKGDGVDLLSMTATPIPRSLALTLFGNMTLSYIAKRPYESAPRQTKVLDRDQANLAYEAIRQAVGRGEQAYIVCPLIGRKLSAPDADDQGKSLAGEHDEEHVEWGFISIEDEADFEGAAPKDVESHADFIRKSLPGVEVGVLHGRMSSDQKTQVMQDFRDGVTDVLVSTTVVEVGVDVPNATVMVIEDADRFGLSQLHQLRGRVGRSDKAAQVFLLSGTRVPVALRRLSAMEKSEDGFELSEFDLSCRHEGDILGNRQHGASTLRLVQVVRDKGLIEAAHNDAKKLLTDDPKLEKPANKALSYEMKRVFSAMVSEGVQG